MSENQTCAIYDDPREIEAIHWMGYDPPAFAVGRAGVTAIVATRECGEHAYVPWLAVYRGDDVTDRLPAHHVHIVYRRTPTPETSDAV